MKRLALTLAVVALIGLCAPEAMARHRHHRHHHRPHYGHHHGWYHHHYHGPVYRHGCYVPTYHPHAYYYGSPGFGYYGRGFSFYFGY